MKIIQSKTINNFFDFILARFSTFVSSSNWILKTSVALVLVSLILSTPDSFNLPFNMTPAKIEKSGTADQNTIWAVNYITRQFNNPFSSDANNYLIGKPQSNGFISHLNKRWPRIAVPVIAWVFHLNMELIYFLQYILAVAFFYIFIKLVSKYSNAVIALMSGITIGFIYVTKTFTTDYFHYDCFAFLFIVLAIYNRKSISSMPFFILAAFTDERSIFTFPMIYLFWIITDHGVVFTIKNLFSNKFQLFSMVFSVIIYLILRYFLQRHLQINTADTSYVGFIVVLWNLKAIPLSLFATLEGCLVLIFIPVIMSLINKNWLFLLLYTFSILICLTAAFMVADLSRSIAYVFPAILIAIVYLVQTEKNKTVAQIMFSIMLVCVFFPSENFALIGTGGQSWILPVFYKLFRHIN